MKQRIFTPAASAMRTNWLRMFMVVFMVTITTVVRAAPTYYGFKIDNREITSENYQSFSDGECWHYDPTQNILYLEEGTLSHWYSDPRYGYLIRIDEDINSTLKICVTGNCKVKGRMCFTYSEKPGMGNHVIYGDGTVTFVPDVINRQVITADQGNSVDLTIKDVTMNITSYGDSGIGFVNSNFSSITLDHCAMHIQGEFCAWFGRSEYNSVTPVLKNCYLADGYFSGGGIYGSGGTATEATIKRKTIGEVSVTIPIPENGQPFPTTCTVNGTGYQYQTGTIEWKKLVENGHWNNVSENDRYYSGTAYKVYLILSATDDNRFYDTDFHAVINGQEASVYQKSDKSVTIYTTFEPKLCVGGTQVTSANCGDVLGDGKVSYDMTSKVLTLNGATISGTGSTSAASTGYGSAIYSMIDGLTIQVTGNNQLTGKTNCHGLYLSGTTTITSQTGGSLTTTGYTGAYLLEGMLIIGGNVTLNATGQGGGGLLGGFGYNGGYEYYATLCIRDKATVNAREDWYGSIAMWKALQLLDGRAIITPSDAVWDGHGVRDADGNYVSSQVTIGAKNFGLKIAGTKVTGNNMTDVLGDGHFRYYENDNTLRIMGNNSTTSDNYHFIENDIPGLTIAVMEAKISARKSAIFSKTDLTIKGGYLTLSSTGDCGIWMEKGAKLTICDIDRLEVENSWYGICGSMNNTLESLHIENAQVVINSTYDAVCDFTGGITLSGCSIIEPVNGRIYKGAIVDQNTIVAKTVLIDAVIPTDISKPSSLNDQGDLYMIDGRKVNAEGALPKGIYIRNGKKILK